MRCSDRNISDSLLLHVSFWCVFITTTLALFLIGKEVTYQGGRVTTQGPLPKDAVDFQPFCGHFPTPQTNLPRGSARDWLGNC